MIEWEQNPPKEPMSWHKAIEYAESLGDGWRLPTRSELINAYDGDVIGFKKNSYWSSNTYAQGTNLAWLVYFGTGYVDGDDKTNCFYYVRCVREVKGE